MKSTVRLPTEERRLQLTDAALALLHEEGARAVTVANIAKRVGITSGAVFRHFSNTQTLFDAAVERFEEALPPFPAQTLGHRERLGRFFIERVCAVQDQPEILGLSMSDRLETLLSKAGADRLQTLIKQSIHFLSSAFADAQAAGDIDKELSIPTLVWMTTGAMRGAARSGCSAEAAWHDVERVLFRAGATKSAAPKRSKKTSSAPRRSSRRPTKATK